MVVWRQTYNVWLIYRTWEESYKSAKIRLYKSQGAWELMRLNSEGSWVAVSKNNQVNKAIETLLVQLRELAD